MEDINKHKLMRTALMEKIYYVECAEDSTVLVAIDVELEGEQIRWFDTVKERAMRVREVLDSNPRHFVFVRNDGKQSGTYTLTPMDIETYNTKVRARLINGKEFSLKEEMLAAFEETKKDVW